MAVLQKTFSWLQYRFMGFWPIANESAEEESIQKTHARSETTSPCVHICSPNVLLLG